MAFLLEPCPCAASDEPCDGPGTRVHVCQDGHGMAVAGMALAQQNNGILYLCLGDP